VTGSDLGRCGDEGLHVKLFRVRHEFRDFSHVTESLELDCEDKGETVDLHSLGGIHSLITSRRVGG